MTSMTAQFKDGTPVRILSVNISETYGGLLAGTFTVATRHHIPCILARMEKLMSGKEKGYYCLPPELVDEAELRGLSPRAVANLRNHTQVDKCLKDQEMKAMLHVSNSEEFYTISLEWFQTAKELSEHPLPKLIQGAVGQLTFEEIKDFCEVTDWGDL